MYPHWTFAEARQLVDLLSKSLGMPTLRILTRNQGSIELKAIFKDVKTGQSCKIVTHTATVDDVMKVLVKCAVDNGRFDVIVDTDDGFHPSNFPSTVTEWASWLERRIKMSRSESQKIKKPKSKKVYVYRVTDGNKVVYVPTKSEAIELKEQNPAIAFEAIDAAKELNELAKFIRMQPGR